MYLLQELIDCEGRSFKMSGVLQGTSSMESKRQGLRYVVADAICDNVICKRGETFAHTNSIGLDYRMSRTIQYFLIV